MGVTTKRSPTRKPPFGKKKRQPHRYSQAAGAAASFWSNEEVQKAAKALSETQCVHGVAFGVRRRAGSWIDEPCISVFVERKWPQDRLKKGEDFGERFPMVPIDVVEVGTPRVATIDAKDRVLRNGINDRSAITTLVWYTSGTWVLACGHGVVPDGRPGTVVTDRDERWVVVSDDRTVSYRAMIYAAEFDGVRDVALLRVDNSPPPRLGHPLNGSEARHTLRKQGVYLGLRVRQFSPERQKVVLGKVTAIADQRLPSTNAKIRAPNGDWVTYPEVYAVIGDEPDDTFAVGGDSGSLVMDDAGGVVGTVIGRSARETLADGSTTGIGFVLPLTENSLDTRAKGIDLRSFFR